MTRRRTDERRAGKGNGWVPLEEIVSKDIFKSEVRIWAERIGVEANELHIRPMSRKWGSCSTAGRLSFNADLLKEPAVFRKNVIVHELLHLRVPNHGKLFRALLKAYLGLNELELPPPETARRQKPA